MKQPKPFASPISPKPLPLPVPEAAKVALGNAQLGSFAYHPPRESAARMERPRGGKGPRNPGA